MALGRVSNLTFIAFINANPNKDAMLMRINNDKVGEIDSLLQTIPKGVVDQTRTTTKKATETGIKPFPKINTNSLEARVYTLINLGRKVISKEIR